MTLAVAILLAATIAAAVINDFRFLRATIALIARPVRAAFGARKRSHS